MLFLQQIKIKCLLFVIQSLGLITSLWHLRSLWVRKKLEKTKERERKTNAVRETRWDLHLNKYQDILLQTVKFQSTNKITLWLKVVYVHLLKSTKNQIDTQSKKWTMIINQLRGQIRRNMLPTTSKLNLCNPLHTIDSKLVKTTTQKCLKIALNNSINYQKNWGAFSQKLKTM